MLLGVLRLLGYDGYVHLEPDVPLKHRWPRRSPLVFDPKRHRTGHGMT